MNEVGSFWEIQKMMNLGKGFQLVGTGLTPGAGIAAIGLSEGVDAISGSGWWSDSSGSNYKK